MKLIIDGRTITVSKEEKKVATVTISPADDISKGTGSIFVRANRIELLTLATALTEQAKQLDK